MVDNDEIFNLSYWRVTGNKIGGVAFVTQFLMDAADRADELAIALERLESGYVAHVDVTRELIKSEFSKINDATELFGLVEASALKTDAMTRLVKNSTTIAKGSPSLIFDFAQAEINRYTYTPTYQLSYLLGRVLLLQVRADEQRRLGDRFELRAFHDSLLANGSLPISFHRRILRAAARAGGAADASGGSDGAGASRAARR